MFSERITMLSNLYLLSFSSAGNSVLMAIEITNDSMNILAPPPPILFIIASVLRYLSSRLDFHTKEN